MSLGHLAPYVGRALSDPAQSRAPLFDLSVGLVEDVRSTSALYRVGPAGVSRAFQLALPYRGFFVWHVGSDEVAGDVNQALFVTAGERYRLSHPLACGYAELILTPAPDIVAELAHGTSGSLGSHPLFRRRSRRLTPALQSFRSRFLNWASDRTQVDVLAAEELVLALLRSAFEDAAPLQRPALSTQRLIRRTKTFLEAELAKPIRLADVGRAVGASPVYLTQIFRASEGVPLHQYLNQLRLARALAGLPGTDDLTKLALDVGFSSHSHFSARFRREFGTTPSRFREQSRAGLSRGIDREGLSLAMAENVARRLQPSGTPRRLPGC